MHSVSAKCKVQNEKCKVQNVNCKNEKNVLEEMTPVCIIN